MKIRPVGTELLHVDRHTNGRTDGRLDTTHASDDSEDFQYGLPVL